MISIPTEDLSSNIFQCMPLINTDFTPFNYLNCIGLFDLELFKITILPHPSFSLHSPPLSKSQLYDLNHHS